MKSDLKNKAVELRSRGNTYSEILRVIPVSKSTLSLWLRDVGISKRQLQAFTEKKRLASLRGGQAKRAQRIAKYNQITERAEMEIGKMSKRELWLLGIALYWAEGSKEKDSHPGSGISFSNSDSKMIHLFLKWLFEVVGISKEQINCEIYVHDSYRNEIARFQEFWADQTGLPLDYFQTIYFKKTKVKTLRRNIGDLYSGQLRVKVYASSSLNRRVAGWVRGITKFWGVV